MEQRGQAIAHPTVGCVLCHYCPMAIGPLTLVEVVESEVRSTEQAACRPGGLAESGARRAMARKQVVPPPRAQAADS